MKAEMIGNEYRHGIQFKYFRGQFFHPEMPGRGYIPRDEFIPIAMKFLNWRTVANTVPR